MFLISRLYWLSANRLSAVGFPLAASAKICGRRGETLAETEN